MIEVRDLYKEFPSDKGEVKAVNSVSFHVPAGKLFTLLGPSGCGKTTTLRCIAGLERPDSGEIMLDNRKVFSSEEKAFVPPNHRDIGMVFQSYAIWPHMNVYDNVAFPLKVGKKKYSRAQIKEKVERSLAVVRLEGLETRSATKLSGGQQQRLALARALVREPQLLLLDEPLSNLDAKLREQMRVELKLLQRQIGITSIYVTHDQVEALALSNIIAVMQDGVIQQIGPPREIYQRPANKFVADFIGSTNWVEGIVVGNGENDGLKRIETPHGYLTCAIVGEGQPGEQVAISIRPEFIDVQSIKPESGDFWQARVEIVSFLGEYIDCQLRVGDTLLKARAHPSLIIRTGQEVYLTIPAESCTAIAS